MSNFPTPTTELDAVNTLLQSIGESKVLDLETDLEEVTVARDTIREVSLDVQTWGWTFNTENSLLEVEQGTGFIRIPQNTLSVDALDPYRNITQRGGALYDVDNNTYVFCQPVKCRLVISLPFDCLPQHAKQYIMARAGRRYAERFLGADNYTAFSQSYEAECTRLFKRIEGRHGDYNILTGSADSQRILDRYPRSRRRGPFGR